jgi:hypothetical protein
VATKVRRSPRSSRPRARDLRVGNVGSRAVIEQNGGVLEDERSGKLRFWMPRS